MNAHTVKALFLDALYQVLDNKVFRILAGIVLLFVFATFAVGFREDEIVILFGWKRIFYEDIFNFFGVAFPGLENANQIVLQQVQMIFVDHAAGTFGILFAIAATAFFVPRLLEKGAADTVFSKPVSRLTLLLSRYFAGLLFVALLAVVLVFGMHLGFLVSSGYSDVGFLWSSLTLVYIFALLHGFSVAVGVFTRSTVAAILLTMIFMAFTGCVHGGWKLKEMALEMEALQRGVAQGPGIAEERTRGDQLKEVFFVAIDVLHYTLPKTSEAALIAQKLRHQVERSGYEVQDEATGLLVPSAPRGFARSASGGGLDEGGVVWTGPEATGDATIALSRSPLEGRGRKEAAERFQESLRGRAGVGDVSNQSGHIADSPTVRYDWVEDVEGVVRKHRAHVFVTSQHAYVLEIEGAPEWYDASSEDKAVQEFARSITFDEGPNSQNPMERFAYRFSWTAPLKYNIFFSIGSSLAFLAAILALAWWRLSRIDF